MKKIAFVDFPSVPGETFLSALQRELADPSTSALCIRFPVTAGEARPEELQRLCSAPPMLSDLRQTLRSLEKGAKPVAAWLESDLSGLAFEAALACHRRLTHQQQTRFQWPWMRFGLPPLLGTAQRLPYLVGLKAALDCLLFGQPIINESATDPLIVRVDNNSPEETIGAWISGLEKPVQPWDRTDVTGTSLWSQTIPNRALLQATYLRIRQKSPPEDLAPGLLLQVFHDGLERSFDAALKLEAAAFEKARTAPSTKQRVYV
ncbi:MAG TPA: hypothetical protein VE242_03715, partial [Chthoniobacterales bacterium]|nr:hypothetical protein [Chthoniobacterales bacterium]